MLKVKNKHKNRGWGGIAVAVVSGVFVICAAMQPSVAQAVGDSAGGQNVANVVDLSSDFTGEQPGADTESDRAQNGAEHGTNEAYVNPQYREYQNLPEAEKEKVELLPDPVIIDYDYGFGGQPSENSGGESFAAEEIPRKYDLRNINGKNYLSPLKDQGSLGLCWIFSAVQNAETLIALKNPQAGEVKTFSIRQVDYATSNNGLTGNNGKIDPNSLNASRPLAGAGNFYNASILLANGLGLVDDELLPWDESMDTRPSSQILNYNNSRYEVDGTLQMAQISADSASEDKIKNYVGELKRYMLKYGGPFVGTYSPQSTCGFTNADGERTLKTDDCVKASASLGHAMQIIGWDDDYEYAYCDGGKWHYSAVAGRCAKGEYTSGKGAWILRNSWGEGSGYDYVYLTYDSTRLSVGFITQLADMGERSWQNNYHANPWIEADVDKGMIITDADAQSFAGAEKLEKIEKIKFLNMARGARYKISVAVGEREYREIATAEIPEAGFYTFDLTDKNIILTGGEFRVRLEGEGGAKFVENSISVFTADLAREDLLIGDVNGDGKVSSADYVKIRKHIMASEVISDALAFWLADVNGDGKISSADYVKIRKYIMNGGEL